MVETVHAARPHALVLHIAVPSLPDGGGSVVDTVEPAGVLALVQESVGNVAHAVLGEGGHEDGGAQEARLQAVAMLLEVLSQARLHALPGLPLHQVVLEGK